MRAVLLVTFALWGLAACRNYEGYKVYNVVAKTEAENQYLLSLKDNEEFDFWSPPNKASLPVVVMAGPRVQGEFERHLRSRFLHFSVQIQDVERTIQDEREYHRRALPVKEGRISFTQYHSHAAINAYLDQVASDHPDLVTLQTIGRSYQGRDLNLIRISTGPRNPPKPVIFVDAGIHAREWIAPSVALYIIEQLVETASNRDLVENVDWIVFPSVNPDGYEYSRNSDRLWRKTRSTGSQCAGCDGNRNFDYHWMEAGASSWECSDTYAGKEAFSEPETTALRNYILNTSNVEAYLTFHSYGQYLLYPWGYADILAPNWRELQSLGEAADAAIRAVNGTRYSVGGATALLYAAAGASDDWAMGGAGISIVYTIELPGGGTYGFDLPASRIQGVVRETWEGVKVIARYVEANRQ